MHHFKTELTLTLLLLVSAIILLNTSTTRETQYLTIIVTWLPIMLVYIWTREFRLIAELRNKEAREQEILSLNCELTKKAHTDSLTGLLNRNGITEKYKRMSEDRRTSENSTAYIMCDIDHFKKINDEFGHGTGDDVLKDFADILADCFRADDIVGRWGGEEFVIICNNIDKDNAGDIAEQLRARVVNASLLAGRTVTASFGVCVTPRAVKDISLALENADSALYVSKGQGRNQVTLTHWAD